MEIYNYRNILFLVLVIVILCVLCLGYLKQRKIYPLPIKQQVVNNQDVFFIYKRNQWKRIDDRQLIKYLNTPKIIHQNPPLLATHQTAKNKQYYMLDNNELYIWDSANGIYLNVTNLKAKKSILTEIAPL